MTVLKLALILAITILELTSHQSLVQAYPSQKSADIKQDPPVWDRPNDDRKPAGTRGPCENTKQPFTPLLPIANSGVKFSGFTLKEYPIFWFYIPYQSSTINRGAFFLENLQEGTRTYQVNFQLPETPGFVKISLPTTANPLELNKQYRWQFTLYCETDDPTDSSQVVLHEGLVERLDPQPLETQMATALVIDRMEFYRDNRLWYDISADLTQIYNSPLAWRYLLQAIDLEELKQEPIAGSVQPVGDSNEIRGNRE